MNKTVIVLITLMLVSIGFLSGCNENRNVGTQIFIVDLQPTEDTLCRLLNNLYVNQKDFDAQFKWTTVMNQVVMNSTIDSMDKNRSNIIVDIDGLDSAEKVYYEDKLNANLEELTSQQKTQANRIKEMIDYYNTKENNLLEYVDMLDLYIDFVNYTRIKMTLLEDNQNTFNLMISYVDNAEYEKAIRKGLELLQIYHDLKDNEFARANLNMLNYSEEILSVWDLYIEGMQYYIKYLNLTLDGRYSQAEIQHNLYEDRFNQAKEIEGSKNPTATNEEIDSWYNNNIGVYTNMFVDYYQCL